MGIAYRVTLIIPSQLPTGFPLSKVSCSGPSEDACNW